MRRPDRLHRELRLGFDQVTAEGQTHTDRDREEYYFRYDNYRGRRSGSGAFTYRHISEGHAQLPGTGRSIDAARGETPCAHRAESIRYPCCLLWGLGCHWRPVGAVSRRLRSLLRPPQRVLRHRPRHRPRLRLSPQPAPNPSRRLHRRNKSSIIGTPCWRCSFPASTR
jgi:hypothetical protein